MVTNGNELHLKKLQTPGEFLLSCPKIMPQKQHLEYLVNCRSTLAGGDETCAQ